MIYLTKLKIGVYLSTNVQLVEDFKFWANVAEKPNSSSKNINCEMFRTWSEARPFPWRNIFLDYWDVFREAHEELSTYRDIIEISNHVKKSEPIKEFGKGNETILKVVIL